MFKSLNLLVSKRFTKIAKVSDKNSEIKTAVQDFLKDQFGDISSNLEYGLVYDDTKKLIVIKCANKSVANELTFKIRELQEFFKNRKIKIERVSVQ